MEREMRQDAKKFSMGMVSDVVEKVSMGIIPDADGFDLVTKIVVMVHHNTSIEIPKKEDYDVAV